jgi:hypothetical protein
MQAIMAQPVINQTTTGRSLRSSEFGIGARNYFGTPSDGNTSVMSPSSLTICTVEQIRDIDNTVTDRHAKISKRIATGQQAPKGKPLQKKWLLAFRK